MLDLLKFRMTHNKLQNNTLHELKNVSISKLSMLEMLIFMSLLVYSLHTCLRCRDNDIHDSQEAARKEFQTAGRLMRGAVPGTSTNGPFPSQCSCLLAFAVGSWIAQIIF